MGAVEAAPLVCDDYIATIISGYQVIHLMAEPCGGPARAMVAQVTDLSWVTWSPADSPTAEGWRKACMIGGFDQFHCFVGCTPEETRAEVRRCFAAAGGNGGYILSPSDHFFEAEPELLHAFVDEAHKCIYSG